MPKPKDPDNWERLWIRVPPELHDWLWQEARSNFRTISGQVTFILIQYHYLKNTQGKMLKSLLKEYQVQDADTNT